MNKTELKKLAEKINDYHIAHSPESGDNHWERGAYFIGDLAAYRLIGKKEYLDYALRWANDNEWRFSRDPEFKSVNPDSKICGQAYYELMDLIPGCGTDRNMLPTLEYNFSDENNDYWWWIDSIYMALPFYSMYSKRTGDKRGYEKAYRLFNNTKTERRLYDEEEKLWYRDERFLPERELTPNGKKIFWSRGNGWVFAGLSRAAGILPDNEGHRDEYVKILRDMAESVSKTQDEDGLWRVSLYDKYQFDVPESSGTLLFVYGMINGINKGILDGKYIKNVISGFKALLDKCVDKDWRVGWVQGIAWGPSPVEKKHTNDYAVGTILLAISGLCEYLDKTGKEDL